MHLGCAPPLGVFAKRDAARARVDILAGDDCGGHLLEPALRIGLAIDGLRVLSARPPTGPALPIGLAIEVLRVLLAGRVAVACPPPPVGTLRDARHYQPPFPIPSKRPQVARLACCCDPTTRR